MSNFAADDVHRSLRRFVWQALPDGWKVRTERQPTSDEERPVAVVEPASAITTGRHRISIPQGNVEKLQTFSTMAYPALGKTARESRAVAQLVVGLLDQAFTLGLVEDQPEGDPVKIGGPFMVPIYDFDDVPVTGRGRAGPQAPYGYAEVDDLAVRPVQDPVDYLRFTVTADARLTWEQGGRIPPVAPIARHLDPTPVITP